MSHSRIGSGLLGGVTAVSLVVNLALLIGPSVVLGSPGAPTPAPAPTAPPAEAQALPPVTALPTEPAPPAAEPASSSLVQGPAPVVSEPEVEDAPRDDATTESIAASDKLFRRIVRAFESMEPANASAALVVLAERDHDSVVRSLLVMDPRRAGLILDAMSRKAPTTAAVLTADMLAEASPGAFAPAR